MSAATDDLPGFAFDPRPPQPGESAAEAVAGFLEAMRATPIRTTVARQFLSRGAAETWQPEQQIITYAELGTPSGDTSVQIPMSDVNLYDARGAWQRAQVSRVLSLGLVQEEGEWRIDEVPDALIVPDSWFDDSFERIYQSIRRSYRFGQTEAVYVDFAYVPELQGVMFTNVRRKQRQFDEDTAIQEEHYRRVLMGGAAA